MFRYMLTSLSFCVSEEIVTSSNTILIEVDARTLKHVINDVDRSSCRRQIRIRDESGVVYADIGSGSLSGSDVDGLVCERFEAVCQIRTKTCRTKTLRHNVVAQCLKVQNHASCYKYSLWLLCFGLEVGVTLRRSASFRESIWAKAGGSRSKAALEGARTEK